jgi:hypothetical protein
VPALYEVAMRRLALSAVALTTAAAFAAPAAQAQTTEERFQDLFVTAGYATAFGAAIGTAFLAWTDDPASNLKYVAVGASVGFLGGSILGSYIIFSPLVGDASHPQESTLLAGGALPAHGVVVRPVFDRETHSVVAVESGMTLVDF